MLCHRLARFAYRRDRAGRFRFVPLRSKVGQQLQEQGGLDANQTDTFVLVQDGCFYTKSDAALRVFCHLDRAWPILFGLVLLPKWFRNRVYDGIARRRYRIFGRTDVCSLPEAGLRARFVEELEEMIE